MHFCDSNDQLTEMQWTERHTKRQKNQFHVNKIWNERNKWRLKISANLLQPVPVLPLGEPGGCLGHWAKGGAKRTKNTIVFRTWWAYTKQKWM